MAIAEHAETIQLVIACEEIMRKLKISGEEWWRS